MPKTIVTEVAVDRAYLADTRLFKNIAFLGDDTTRGYECILSAQVDILKEDGEPVMKDSGSARRPYYDWKLVLPDGNTLKAEKWTDEEIAAAFPAAYLALSMHVKAEEAGYGDQSTK